MLRLADLRQALHIAASTPSPIVLEYILAYPECDVDPINRIERATPLHLAARIPDPELRLQVVQSLLEAGADTKDSPRFVQSGCQLTALP